MCRLMPLPPVPEEWKASPRIRTEAETMMMMMMIR